MKTQRLLTFLNTSGIGYANNDQTLKEKVILTNWVGFIFSTIVLFYGGVYALSGLLPAAIICWALVIAYGVILFLNAYEWSKTSRLLYGLASNTAIFSTAKMFPSLSVELFCFMSACVPMLLFAHKEWKYALLGSSVAILTFFLCVFAPAPEFIPTYIPQGTEAIALYSFTLFGVFLCLIALVMFFSYSNQVAQGRLIR